MMRALSLLRRSMWLQGDGAGPGAGPSADAAADCHAAEGPPGAGRGGAQGGRRLAGSPEFCVGDLVTWIGDDQDVPNGSVGTATGIGKEHISVKFERGTFSFLPTELEHFKTPGWKSWFGWFSATDPATDPAAAADPAFGPPSAHSPSSSSSRSRLFSDDPRDIHKKPFLAGQTVMATSSLGGQLTGIVRYVGLRGVGIEYDSGFGKHSYDTEDIARYGLKITGRGSLPPEPPPARPIASGSYGALPGVGQEPLCLKVCGRGPCAADEEERLRYLGGGHGDYVQEVTYRYVGVGAGEFGKVDAKEPGNCATFASLCCVATLAILAVSAFTLHAGSDSPASLKASPAPTSATSALGQVAWDLQKAEAARSEADKAGGEVNITLALDLLKSCHTWCLSNQSSWSHDRAEWCCTNCREGCTVASHAAGAEPPSGGGTFSAASPAVVTEGPPDEPPRTSTTSTVAVAAASASATTSAAAAVPLTKPTFTRTTTWTSTVTTTGMSATATVTATTTTTAPPATTTTARATTTPPLATRAPSTFDCMQGFADWVHLWPLGQKDWCCQHFGRACFHRIEAGTCLAIGMLPILNSSVCQAAAQDLGLDGRVPQLSRDIVDRPEGCYSFHHLQDGSRTVWINLDPSSRGKGAETSKPSLGEFRQPICGVPAARSWPPQGTGTTTPVP